MQQNCELWFFRNVYNNWWIQGLCVEVVARHRATVHHTSRWIPLSIFGLSILQNVYENLFQSEFPALYDLVLPLSISGISVYLRHCGSCLRLCPRLSSLLLFSLYLCISDVFQKAVLTQDVTSPVPLRCCYVMQRFSTLSAQLITIVQYHVSKLSIYL
jgi:hypothetical protein